MAKSQVVSNSEKRRFRDRTPPQVHKGPQSVAETQVKSNCRGKKSHLGRERWGGVRGGLTVWQAVITGSSSEASSADGRTISEVTTPPPPPPPPLYTDVCEMIGHGGLEEEGGGRWCNHGTKDLPPKQSSPARRDLSKPAANARSVIKCDFFFFLHLLLLKTSRAR